LLQFELHQSQAKVPSEYIYSNYVSFDFGEQEVVGYLEGKEETSKKYAVFLTHKP
jgi:hypothetical protein